MTGCARFFIFLLIFTPIVLIGVSIYNGNNPIDQIKDLLNIEQTEKTIETRSDDKTETSSTISSEAILKSTIETQKTTIQELRNQVEDLEKQIKDKDREIQFLKQSGNE
jgi:cell division protein FtsB